MDELEQKNRIMEKKVQFCPQCEKVLRKKRINNIVEFFCPNCGYTSNHDTIIKKKPPQINTSVLKSERELVLKPVINQKIIEKKEEPNNKNQDKNGILMENENEKQVQELSAQNLEIDSEEENEDDESLGRSYDDTLRVNTEQTNRTVYELNRSIQLKRLELQPIFQRKYVWDEKIASRLIESIILKLPIPLIFTSERKDEKLGMFIEEVIDGQQRLTSISRFLNNEYKLKGLEILDEKFKYKRFTELEPRFQQEIENYPLTIVKIKHNSDPEIKFHLFSRINRGSVNLSPQELRNCIFWGKFNDLINELAENPNYCVIMENSISRSSKDRMKKIELILRFMALAIKKPTGYSYPMTSFLNKFMEENRNPTDEKIQEWRNLFENTISLVKEILGTTPFKRTDLAMSDRGRKSLLNEALFDCVMITFSKYQMKDLSPIKSEIQDGIMELITNNKDFIDAISGGKVGSTSSVKHLRNRIQIFSQFIDNLLQASKIKTEFIESQKRTISDVTLNSVENLQFMKDVGIEYPQKITTKAFPIKISILNKYSPSIERKIILFAQDLNSKEIIGASNIVDLKGIDSKPTSVFISLSRMPSKIELFTKDFIHNTILHKKTIELEISGYDDLI
jgi:uncharacterized protein with ParB-like and HNH nuclease domain/predicted RNA-binding Zn-ribbon protein involved in translation (DUF1610 family)